MSKKFQFYPECLKPIWVMRKDTGWMMQSYFTDNSLKWRFRSRHLNLLCACYLVSSVLTSQEERMRRAWQVGRREREYKKEAPTIAGRLFLTSSSAEDPEKFQIWMRRKKKLEAVREKRKGGAAVMWGRRREAQRPNQTLESRADANDPTSLH